MAVKAVSPHGFSITMLIILSYVDTLGSAGGLAATELSCMLEVGEMKEF